MHRKSKKEKIHHGRHVSRASVEDLDRDLPPSHAKPDSMHALLNDINLAKKKGSYDAGTVERIIGDADRAFGLHNNKHAGHSEHKQPLMHADRVLHFRQNRVDPKLAEQVERARNHHHHKQHVPEARFFHNGGDDEVVLDDAPVDAESDVEHGHGGHSSRSNA